MRAVGYEEATFLFENTGWSRWNVWCSGKSRLVLGCIIGVLFMGGGFFWECDASLNQWLDGYTAGSK